MSERSTASKVIFGTFLTNGLIIGVFGLIVFLVGLSGRYEIRLNSGGVITGANLVVIGFLILLVGLTCVCVHLVKKKETSQNTTYDVKKCPFCANDIKKEAIVCQYCNRDLTS